MYVLAILVVLFFQFSFSILFSFALRTRVARTSKDASHIKNHSST
ncbi:hypothetical protein HMPREF1573_00488 [Gardnerella vaginalis JCP7276]|nr:hypothetical protein HMPREF1575_00464 [Gardnerella vaginalis JCP7672]EPI57056.1 hypothetical protein HMPREF1573_00488 [Gardnerella vaginalis JCP7276]EPI58088.1 hypothetical protein HMPREF1572_00050 [Gardnerella vaginalis JCP7275]